MICIFWKSGVRANVFSIVPFLYWIYLPFYLRADRIIVCDLSFINGIRQTAKIENFCQWLSKWGWASKIERLDMNDYDDLRWRVNTSAVMFLHQKYAFYRKQKHIIRYFTGYLAHRKITSVVSAIFVQRLIKQLFIDTHNVVMWDSNHIWLRQFHKFSPIVGIVLSPLFLTIQRTQGRTIRIFLQSTKSTNLRAAKGTSCDFLFPHHFQ